jgi:integrase/recombinase XerD
MAVLPAVPDPRPVPDIPAPKALQLRGTPPAAGPAALLDLLRAAGAAPDVIEATEAWLGRRESAHSRTAYAKDASWWLAWCASADTDPTRPRAVDTDKYGAALREAGLAKTTRARRLAVASAWYEYLVRAEIADRNPFAGMDRPKVSQDDSTTSGLTPPELGAILAHARDHESARTYALLVTLATTAGRITSILTATVGAMGHDQGHRVLDLIVKGDKKQRVILVPLAVEAIERQLAGREEPQPEEFLFPTSSGAPIDEPAAFRTLRRVARAAGIEGANQISPHSLRHSYATAMLDQGVPLHHVQDAMGHADPRTTRRYDRARGALRNSPAYKMQDALAAAMNAPAHSKTLCATSRTPDAPPLLVLDDLHLAGGNDIHRVLGVLRVRRSGVDVDKAAVERNLDLAELVEQLVLGVRVGDQRSVQMHATSRAPIEGTHVRDDAGRH